MSGCRLRRRRTITTLCFMCGSGSAQRLRASPPVRPIPVAATDVGGGVSVAVGSSTSCNILQLCTCTVRGSVSCLMAPYPWDGTAPSAGRKRAQCGQGVIGDVVEEVHGQARASHVACHALALLPLPSQGCCRPTRRRGVALHALGVRHRWYPPKKQRKEVKKGGFAPLRRPRPD